jgi:hypothetical protein
MIPYAGIKILNLTTGIKMHLITNFLFCKSSKTPYQNLRNLSTITLISKSVEKEDENFTFSKRNTTFILSVEDELRTFKAQELNIL